MHIPESLKKLASVSAVPIYIVGGYVRNHLAGLGKTDIDLCGAVPPLGLNLPPQYRVDVVNFRLGTAIIKCGDAQFEYTPFRTESYDGGSHTPTNVFFTTDIAKDCARRDFTANAVYFDISNKKIIDLCGGVSDIKQKVLRAVNEKTFCADGLRIMRLVRIAAQIDFKLEANTVNLAKQNLQLLTDISFERKRDELEKMLVADTANGIANAHYRALKLAGQLGLWQYVIPQLETCRGFAQDPKYHKYDVYEHSLQCVKFASTPVRRAALLHDIGKPYTMQAQGNMHGHEVFSARFAKSILKQLKYSNAIIKQTEQLVAAHMYDLDEQTSEAKLRLFLAKNWDIIDMLIDLQNSDALAIGNVAEVKKVHRFSEVRLKMIEEGTPIALSDLNINGSDCIDNGINGADINVVLQKLHRECIINPKLNNKEWLLNNIKIK